MKIAIGYNTSHYAWMFRSNLIMKLVNAGHSVVVIAPTDEDADKFESIGARHIDLKIKMDKNPFSDLIILMGFYKILKREDIDIFLGYTIKPNIYGSIASHFLGIKVINNIAGLGTTFINDGMATKIIKVLYKLAVTKSYKVFFQNKDDMAMFVEEGIVNHDKIDLLPGSGVDLKKFFPVALRKHGDEFRFLLIARMLWDKGVMEYVDAARLIKERNKFFVFQLLGPLDVPNPAAIPKEEVLRWMKEGIVDYIGVSKDVRNEISNVDCVVLPSYREGTPRSLLEAAAMGKPIVTTNAVGCKEVVEHNYNGYLCNVRDHIDLAEKMMRIASLAPQEIKIMGENSRKKAETQFDENIVLDRYFDLITSMEQLK
jgi:glycosyltransferase involved in cell wall biosynthesis